MAILPASFIQRKNQVLGNPTTPTTTTIPNTGNSVLPSSFITRKQEILDTSQKIQQQAQQQAQTNIKNSIFTDLPLSTMGVGTNQIQYPKAATATPKQNAAVLKTFDLIKNTRNTVNDFIGKEAPNIFIPKAAYAPEDEKNLKQLVSDYTKETASSRRNTELTISGLYTGYTGGIIKPTIVEPKGLKEKAIYATSYLLGALPTYRNIGKGVDKIFTPKITTDTLIRLTPNLSDFVKPIVKSIATFDIYGQLDPDQQNRSKKLFIDTVTAIPFAILNKIQIGLYKVPTSFALGYSMAKATGASNEDALINGSLLALLSATEALTAQRGKGTQSVELTGEQYKRLLIENNVIGTKWGEVELNRANTAITNGQQILLDLTDVRQSILNDILKQKTINLTNGEKTSWFKSVKAQIVGKGTQLATTQTSQVPETQQPISVQPIAPVPAQSAPPILPPIVIPPTITAVSPQIPTTQPSIPTVTVEKPIETKPVEVTKPVEKIVEKPKTTEVAVVKDNKITDFKVNDTVYFHKFEGGKVVGVDNEPFVVKEIHPEINKGSGGSILVVDNKGKETWTTPTIIQTVESKPIKYKENDIIAKKEIIDEKLPDGIKLDSDITVGSLMGEPFSTVLVKKNGKSILNESDANKVLDVLNKTTKMDWEIDSISNFVFHLKDNQLSEPIKIGEETKPPTITANKPQETIKIKKPTKKVKTIKPKKKITEEAIIRSEVAKEQRSLYSKYELENISKIKKASNLKMFSEGDVETLNKKYPTLMSDLVEAVRRVEHNPDLTDGEALEIMLNLPSEKMTQPSFFASSERFADLKNLTQQFKSTTPQNLQQIEMPEMVRLAKDLMGGVPTVKKLRSTKMGTIFGLFKPKGKGEIYLNPEIFKETGQAAKTLAHELGHLTDYLPSKTMARGNLIGRIATLRKFLRQTFSGEEIETRVDDLIKQRNDLREQRKDLKDVNGKVTDKATNNRILTALKQVNKEIKTIRKKVVISNPKIKAELERLTRIWKPFTKSMVTTDSTGKQIIEKRNLNKKEVIENINPKVLSYRYSPEELYADAISVLYNDPILLQKKAPKFTKAFFQYLDKKPEVKKAYMDLQNLLLAGDDAVMKLRLEDIDKNYKEGNDALNAKYIESANQKLNIVRVIDTAFNDKNAIMNRKVQEAIKQGKSIRPEINPVYILSGLNYLDGEVKNFFVDNFQKVHLQTAKVPDGWNALGKILQLERSIYERGELANPGGFDPKTGKETLKALKETFTPKEWKTLRKAKRLFRKGVRAVNRFAAEHEYRTPELTAQLKANKYYASYQVLDYLDTYITPQVYHGQGTLKGVANPATSTVMKSVSTIRSILYNDAKKANLDFMKEYFSDEIEPAKMRFTGKRQEAIKPKDKNKVLTMVVEKGKLKGYYIDKELDLIFNNTTETTVKQLGKLSRYLTGAGLYRPMFTSLNLGFQIFNFKKDFERYWRNMPDKTLGDIIKSYPKILTNYAASVPIAWRSVTNKPDAFIKEMENARIIGLTRNDVYGTPDMANEEYITRVLENIGVIPELKTSKARQTPGIKQIVKMFDGIELLGNFIERLPKVAGYRQLKFKGDMSNQEMAHYVRNYIGSPDFMVMGRATPVTNNLFLFSNAAKEGIKGDINMAFRPKTKGAWWFKMLIGTILPKLLMRAIQLGLMGTLLKKIIDGASEYDKTNYEIIPLGLDENGKSIYIRNPKDETGRFVSALTWKLTGIADKEKNQALSESLMDIFSLYSGQLPSLVPSVSGSTALMTYLSGRNPYDSFRNRLIIPETTFNAGFKYSFPVMLKWLSQNQGLGMVIPSYTPQGEMTQLEKILNLPVLSNIVGRFVKVSDYGKTEKSYLIQQEITQKSAEQTLIKREKTTKALDEYIKSGKTPEDQKRISDKLIIDILGKVPTTKEEKSQAKLIDKKFRFAVIAGTNPPEISNVVDATTNEAKAENLKILYDEVDTDKFSNLLKMFVQEGVVTPDTLIKFGEVMGKDETKKETSFKFVKTAYAAESTPTPSGKKYNTYVYKNADGEQIDVQPRHKGITEKIMRDNSKVVNDIVQAATDQNVDPGLMLDMAFSESTFKENPPMNNNSKAQEVKGLFQWKKSSWDMARKALNNQIGEDITNSKDNAIATAWALKTGKIRWWEANGNHIKWSKNYTSKELKQYGWRL